MKEALIKLLFTIGALAIFLLVIGLGNLLAEVITMNMIMTVAYIALGFSFIYLLKN